MLLTLFALGTAWAWPADDQWLALTDGTLPTSDVLDDASPADASLDLFGVPAHPVAAWYADNEALYLRLRVAADPQVSPGVLRAQVYGFLIEADGDEAFEYALISESANGDLRAYPNDGTLGTQPGFEHYGQPWQLGDLTTGNVRRMLGTQATFHLDFRVTRMALNLLGINDDAPLRLTAVTGPSIYVDWADLSSCSIGCDDLSDTSAAPVFLDRDFDGLTDAEEREEGLSPVDADSDDDGILDGDEPLGDADGDNVVNGLDCDSDGDGIRDSVEAGLTADLLGPDSDANASCFRPDLDPSTTTDPYLTDTDAGGLADGVEDWNRNGALDPWETEASDASDDPDADGDLIADVLELQGDDAEINDVDSDGDGLSDAIEGLRDADGDLVPNFLDTDSDDDGLLDSEELDSDPDDDNLPAFLDPDADGDGIGDAIEGLIDSDGDGTSDFLDSDSDGDSLNDAFEGTEDGDGDGLPDYLDEDSDNDTIPDREEGTRDRDDDGIPNAVDLDSDGDGIPDEVEGTDDPDLDGLPNFEDTNSDGQFGDDTSDGLHDTDCDGIADYIDTDEEDSFCDEPQPIPPVIEPDTSPPETQDPLFGDGHFTGGSCSMTGAAGLLWTPVLLALGAIRRRKGVLVGMALTTTASAQEINAQRMMPSVDGQHFVKVEDLVLGDAWSASGGAWVNYADDPFVYRPDDGDKVKLLGSVATTNITGAFSFGRVRIGADLPIHLYAAGHGIDRPTHLGDARLSVKGDVIGFDVGPGHLRLGAVGDLVLPTGAASAWLGSGRTWVRTQAVGQYAWDRLQLAANLGFRSGTGDSFAGLGVGPGMIWGAAGSVSITPAFSAALELEGDVWFGNGGEPGAVPMEWLTTGRYHLTQNWTLIGGVGTGISAGAGSPDFRVVGGLRWSPGRKKQAEPTIVYLPAPERVPGPATLALHAETPWGAAVEGAQVHVLGDLEATTQTGEHGDVELDLPPGDYRVVMNAAGYTPVERAFTLQADRQRDVSLFLNPEEVVVDKVAKRIFLNEKVFFELDQAELKVASLATLDTLVQQLIEHPEIERLRIEGHTDSQGSDEHNQELSEARAEAVLTYLVSQGIEAHRLTPQGFGETRLLQHGDGEHVHATNRRVEFHIETLSEEQTAHR